MMNTATNPPKRSLGIFALAMISVAGIFSLRSLPMMAEYGLGSIFFYAIAALIFFVPSALICAELATAWPKTGGVYVWIREAFGPGIGFLGIWMEWINTVVWFPIILSFIVATLAFAINPQLVQDKHFMLISMLTIFWGITWLNFLGIKISSWFTGIGIILGTLLPGLLIIILGFSWLLLGKTVHLSFSPSALIPHFDLHQDVFFTGVILSFAGMQIAGFHAQEAKNPQRNYPKAILIATILIFIASVLGALAIAIVIPQKQISLVAGLMQTVSLFFNTFHLRWLLPVAAIFTVIGALSALNTWIIGPSKGLLAMADQGDLPNIFKYRNKKNVPIAILLLQAFIGTLLAFVFLFMPTVSSSYWILSALTMQLTMIMYVLLFAASIKLRYSQPNTPRAYKIPGNKLGIWIVAGLGILTAVLSIFIGFVPPTQLHTGNIIFYESFLIGSLAILSLPAVFIAMRKQ